MNGHLLQSHPLFPGGFVQGIKVEVAVEAGEVRLGYRLDGDLSRIRIPPPAGAARADRLWQHTCFEAFVRLGDELRYLELNFSPSGQWAAYEFDDYRAGMRVLELADPPRVAVRLLPADGSANAAGGLLLEARIDLPSLARLAAPRLHLALSAVVEDDAGGLSYWALRHAPERPDFHHPDGFALELPSPCIDTGPAPVPRQPP